MTCRRCGNDFIGSNICPVCGMAQSEFNVIRDFSEIKTPKQKLNGGRLIMLFVIVVALSGVVTLISRRDMAENQTPPAAETSAPVSASERIKLESVELGKPDADGARALTIFWRNLSGKTLKSVHFTAAAYDAEDNPVECEVSGDSVALFKYESDKPIASSIGEVNQSHWPDAWYGENIDYIKIINVIIYYDDGKNSHEVLQMEVVQ